MTADQVLASWDDERFWSRHAPSEAPPVSTSWSVLWAACAPCLRVVPVRRRGRSRGVLAFHSAPSGEPCEGSFAVVTEPRLVEVSRHLMVPDISRTTRRAVLRGQVRRIRRIARADLACLIALEPGGVVTVLFSGTDRAVKILPQLLRDASGRVETENRRANK